ncbi:N-terminal Xaa-Pro-Lys N-methyltransferase 1 [Holothuria leucospilota]|uniref:Alpha N-terminal protein methyltransferase 1 n=1 Tax=Holothuria leucospilota TaxID=206669 RepID=A0A9Q1C718_HOLLE|nr:N-terminal Xaa-Pro-Lys N-methyltransferase 1 [Holothuria leucospilota]
MSVKPKSTMADPIENCFEARNAMKRESFYTDAAEYWSKVPQTVDGMLGGFGSISGIDIQGSLTFLKPFLTAPWPERVQSRRALDCGAGIGRISKHLLLPLFQNVDLVEQNKQFLDEAPNYIGLSAERVEHYYNRGLQDFTPQPKHYDVIWIQWVLGHLTDEHLISFLKRCKTGLADDGLICIKENISHEGVVLDDVDSSVTRSSEEFRKLINAAGLKVVKIGNQKNFPMGLFKVKMYALR